MRNSAIGSENGFQKELSSGVPMMKDRIARLRAHKQNIDRYQSLLATNLSELELQFLQKRLSEERIALAMIEEMSPMGSSEQPPEVKIREAVSRL